MYKPEYVNGFAFTTNDITGEITITMFTTHYNFDDNDQAVSVRDVTGKFIMSYDSAKTLMECLSNAIQRFSKSK